MKSFTSCLMLSAFFGLDYGPIIFRGGGHLISRFIPSLSNIFGDGIQLATLLSSSVIFGILLFMVAEVPASIRYFLSSLEYD